MKRNKIFTLMAAAMTMTACSVSDITDNIAGNGNSVRVESAKVTRATDTQEPEPMTEDFYLVNQTQKEKVDDRYDAVFSYNESTGWTSDADVMWCGSGANEFVAYYPVKTLIGQSLPPIDDVNRFMIPENQLTDKTTNQTLQDSITDWMRATATASKTDNGGNLSLDFKHMLTKVTIVCDYSDYHDDGEEDVTVNVNKIYTRAQYCEATTDDQGNVTINAYQHATNGLDGIYVYCTPMKDDQRKTSSSTVIIAPGEYKVQHDDLYSGFAHAGIYINEDWKSPINIDLPQDMTLEAGKHYTFNVVIKGHDKATISNVTVSNWKSETLPGGGIAKKIPPYVTFSAESGQSFKMTTSSSSYSPPNIEYSVGNGEWTKVVKDAEVNFGGNLGDLRLRGKSSIGTAESISKYSTITFTKNDVPVTCTGDIRTLVDYDNYNTVDTKNARFYRLFNNCTQLTTAPELPATTLSGDCYNSMFYVCQSLKNAPELPATTLAPSCYLNMFYGCTSLTTAPEQLPATTLAPNCYRQMFLNCTSLTTAPEQLPAETLAENCYQSMFSSCNALKNAPKLPATTLAKSCYQAMFRNTALTTAPELPATTLAVSCYYQMFCGCTALTTAPEQLPATTLAVSCYSNMFSGCTALTTTPKLPATTLADDCCKYMFSGCTALTTAPKLPATTLAVSCYYQMFSGCTALTTAPELPATELASNCYQMMFFNCAKLSSVTMLAPANQITATYFSSWLGYNDDSYAGREATSRTLKLDSKDVYDKLKANTNNHNLPYDIWCIGKADVLDKNGNTITE